MDKKNFKLMRKSLQQVVRIIKKKKAKTRESEEAIDYAAFEKRAKEPTRSLESVLKDLKRKRR